MIAVFRSVRRLAMNKMDLTRRGFLQTTNLLAAGTMSLDEAALAGLAESPFSINQPKSSEFGSRAAGPSTRSYKGCINWFLQQSLPSNILPR
jgi:hypothetical protein